MTPSPAKEIEFGWDESTKGELADVQGAKYVQGRNRGQGLKGYWVSPVTMSICHRGAPDWMEIRISRANGGSLIPIGLVSPSAELDMLLGSQQGGVAVLSSGDFWVNGQMRDHARLQPFNKGDTVRIEIMDGKTLMINGQKFQGWRFAVGGYGDQHAFEIVGHGKK